MYQKLRAVDWKYEKYFGGTLQRILHEEILYHKNSYHIFFFPNKTWGIERAKGFSLFLKVNSPLVIFISLNENDKLI